MEISRSKRRWLKGSTVVAICATIFAPSIADADNFPDVDQSKLLITLQRTACLGSCPDYVVSIDGNGHVTFSTSGEPMDAVSGFHRKMSPSRGILYPGRHNDQIDTATVQSLLQQFRKAHFSELHDKYRARITDNPTYVLTIRTGHGSKHVVDYAGGQAGMPASVVDLEDAVDRVAGTSRWVSGAEGLVEWLSKTGFDFHSQEAAYIAVNGMANADEETLIELVDRGAPLDLILDGSNDDGAPVGAELLTGSIQYGRTKLFRKLVAAGWLKRLRPGDGSAAFATEPQDVVQA